MSDTIWHGCPQLLVETLVLLGSEQEENLQIRTRAQGLLSAAKGLCGTDRRELRSLSKVMNVIAELIGHARCPCTNVTILSSPTICFDPKT